MSAASELHITLAGTPRAVAATTTAGQALEADGRTVIAALVNGEPRDLARELPDGGVVEPITIDYEEGRAILRDSTAHVIAQAVQELFPEAKLGIGPPVENGAVVVGYGSVGVAPLSSSSRSLTKPSRPSSACSRATTSAACSSRTSAASTRVRTRSAASSRSGRPGSAWSGAPSPAPSAPGRLRRPS